MRLHKIAIFMIIGLCAAVSGMAQAPAAIEKEFSTLLDNISKSGTYGGSYDEKLLTASNSALKEKLIAYGKRNDVLKYGFPQLKDKMYIATSRDGRLRIYSWDLETGGTMHDFGNVYQYIGKSGKVNTWVSKSSDEPGAGSFCQEVFQVDSASGEIYLPVCTFIGSTTLAGQSISTIRINGDNLVTDDKSIRTGSGLKNSISFGYDFFSVSDHPERPVKLFFFDEAKKSFRFPIVIEDSKTPQGRVTNKFITYRFDGKYFVKES